MHVAVLFEFPTLLGGERSLLAAIDELRRQNVGVEFTALAPQAGPLAEALAARQIRQVCWDAREERRWNRQESALSVLIHELQPDLVHANSLAMGRVLGRIAPQLAVPTTAHLRDILKLSRAAIHDLNRLNQTLAVSHAARAFHIAQGLDGSRAVVIHNGIDLTEFAPQPATGFLHEELHLPRDVRFLAAMGQIGLRKGWNVLAAAVSHLSSLPPSVHLLLVGERTSHKDESRQYEADLREQFQIAGWSDRVHWLGPRTDVSRMLNEVDLLVHPAQQEPLGRVLLEALASGVPIVATDVGGTREIIEPEVSGRLVPANDPVRLAEAITSVLDEEALSTCFRQASRRRAEDQFDIRRAAIKLWNCWQSVRE